MRFHALNSGALAVAAAFLTAGIFSEAGPPPYNLPRAIRDAEVVVVARYIAASRVADRKLSIEPRLGPQFETPLYFCEYRIKPLVNIRGALPAGEEQRVLMVNWRQNCQLSPFAALSDQAPGSIAVWFLRYDKGDLRTAVDNEYTLVGLRAAPEGLDKSVRTLSSPAARLAFVLMAPDVRYSRDSFASHAQTGEWAGLGAWEDFLEAFRAVYLASDEAYRGQLCLSIAWSGMCTECAQAAASGLPNDKATRFAEYLNPKALADFESNHIHLVQADTYEELRRQNRNLTAEEIRQQLIYFSNTSTPQLAPAARQLLEKVFGLKATALPCTVAH